MATQKIFPVIERQNNKSNWIKSFAILLFLTIATFINDHFLRVHYFLYSDQLRLVDHLLAALCIPFIIYFVLGDFYKRCTFYLTWCAYWEVSQFIERGYFQYAQFLFDLFGIGLAIALYKHKKTSSLYNRFG